MFWQCGLVLFAFIANECWSQLQCCFSQSVLFDAEGDYISYSWNNAISGCGLWNICVISYFGQIILKL